MFLVVGGGGGGVGVVGRWFKLFIARWDNIVTTSFQFSAAAGSTVHTLDTICRGPLLSYNYNSVLAYLHVTVLSCEISIMQLKSHDILIFVSFIKQ